MATSVPPLAAMENSVVGEKMTPEMIRREKNAHNMRAKAILDDIRFQVLLCRSPVMEQPSLRVLSDAEILLANLAAKLKAVTHRVPSVDVLRSVVVQELDELSALVAEKRTNIPESKEVPLTFISGASYF